VYFPNRFYNELAVLTGDKGAASIISQFRNEVVLLPVKEAAITEDIDTLLDLDKYLSKNIK
jgi:CTP:molybdopterin cytidylyltransferase MocA